MSPYSPTYYATRLNAEEFVPEFFGRDNHTEAVLTRLDRLTLDETQTTAEEVLKVVYGLVQDTSKQTDCTCLSLAIDLHSPLDGKISGEAVREAPRTFCW